MTNPEWMAYAPETDPTDPYGIVHLYTEDEPEKESGGRRRSLANLFGRR